MDELPGSAGIHSLEMASSVLLRVSFLEENLKKKQ